MNYIKFKSALARFPVFSIADIRTVDARFDRRRLSEWQNKGYIKKIIKGYYFFSDIDIDEKRLFEIACKIYRPSYVSMESALSYYHLIPESVFAITSVSTRRTYTFETGIARFIYRTIQKKLFFGYVIGPGFLKMASMEKAVLDYFYLNSSLKKRDDFESLRINKDAFQEQLNEDRLFNYLKRFNHRALAKRTGDFMEWMRNA